MTNSQASQDRLPDDPRELHQLAISVLIDERLDDAMTDTEALAELIAAAARGDTSKDPVVKAIEVAAMRILDGLHEIERSMKRTSEICRFGTGNFDRDGHLKA